MVNPKIGVIGIPGKWSTEVLADAVEDKTGFRQVIDMAKVSLDISNKRLMFLGEDLCQLDALIVKKISAVYSPDTLSKIELLRIAENSGVRVFSSSNSMMRLINRVSCTVTLSEHNIPMPTTIITEDAEQALLTVNEFGSAIFKPLFSTKARGMAVIEAGTDATTTTIKQAVLDFQQYNPTMYIQKKINLPGRDLGMIFLGGKYLGAYARVPQMDTWNTTINSGGKYVACEPHNSIIDLAYKAQLPFDMDFTTVDVAETDNGPVVFEVSAFGGFSGAKDGMGLNVAELYADYVLSQLK